MNLPTAARSRVWVFAPLFVPVLFLLAAVGPSARAATSSGVFSAVTPLTEAPAIAGDNFGYDYYNGVSISADGHTALIGAPYASVYSPSSSTAVSYAGKAYIYHYANGQWSLADTIGDPDLAYDDYFGYTLALSSDGTAALIGSFATTSSGGYGKAYLYTLTNGAWTMAHEFDNPATNYDDFATADLSLSAHGHTAVLAADEASVSAASNAGITYIYSDASGSWNQTAMIKDPDASSGDFFGYPVAVSGDGQSVLIGSQAAVNGQISAGKAYFYTLANGAWTMTHEFDDPAATGNDYFGDGGVSLSSDGKTAAISAYGANSSQGEIYLYSDASGSWVQTQAITDPDATTSDYFGFPVELSENGQNLVAGSEASVNGLSAAGKAYFYTLANGTWTKAHEFDDPNPTASDYFGSYDVAISDDGETAFFAAYNKTVNGKGGAGEAYIYQSPDDISLALSASPTKVTAGQSVTLDATVTNNDAAVTANNVVLTATLPTGLSYVSSNTGGGSCSASGTTLTCTEASLTPGATWQPSITAKADTKGTFSASGTVASNEPDPATSNNAATASIDVSPSSSSGGGALGLGSLAAFGLLLFAGIKRRN